MSELADDLLRDNAEWVPADRRGELHESVVAIIEDALFEETTGCHVDAPTPDTDPLTPERLDAVRAAVARVVPDGGFVDEEI